MATDTFTPKSIRWNSALAEYKAGLAAVAALCNHSETRIRDDVFNLAVDASQRLFRAPAPMLAAVREKVGAAYGESIWDETEWARQRRRIVGDLCRIEMLLAGVDPAEASGGMDLNKVASDWSEAADDYDTKAGLSHQQSEAGERLLTLAAPDLAAVIKKLQVLLAGGESEDVEKTATLTHILRDVWRFASKHAE